MSIRKIPILFILLIAFLPICVSASTIYDFTGYTSAKYNTNHDNAIYFNYTAGNCKIKMSSYGNFTLSSPFNSNILWNSPDDHVLGVSSKLITTNNSCNYYGSTILEIINMNLTNNLFETSTDFTQSATGGFVKTLTNYVCDVSYNWIEINIKKTDKDRNNNCPYKMRAGGAAQQTIYMNELINNYNNNCNEIYEYYDNSAYSNCQYSVGGTPTGKTVSWIYPFNSSGGIINYSFSDATQTYTGGSSGTLSISYDIIDFETKTNSTLYSQVISGTSQFSNTDGQISLTKDKLYLLVVMIRYRTGDRTAITLIPPDIKLNIYTYHGDFECGEWSECISNSQTQTCVDLNGIAPQEIKSRSCLLASTYVNYRGFESYYSNTTYTCQRNALCSIYLTTMQTKRPINWTLSEALDPINGYSRDYFAEISTETASEGTKSLKMWYVPPKDFEPIPNITDSPPIGNTECGNLTTGKFPESNTNYNESLFVSTGITFPAPYLDIRFDVKKCNNVVQQYGNGYGFCYFLFDPECYGNCNNTPSGKYGARLVDQNGNIIYDYTPETEATNNWKTQVLILDGLLSAGNNYTFALAVNPNNVFDTKSHCVYFDNVIFTYRNDPVSCESQCLDLDYYNAFNDNSGKCYFTIERISSKCVPADKTDIIDDIISCKSTINQTCIDNDLHIYNCDTGKWSIIKDSNICIAEISIIPTTYDDYLNILLNPAFLVLLALSVISIIIGIYIERWELVAIGLLIAVFTLSMYGIIPIIFGIIIGVFIALMLGYFISKVVG